MVEVEVQVRELLGWLLPALGLAQPASGHLSRQTFFQKVKFELARIAVGYERECVRYWLKAGRGSATLVGLVFSTLPAQVPVGTRFLYNAFTERAIFPESALSNRLCHQRATCSDSHDPDNRESDGVAARSPGKALSYLSAMKGEARRDLACHAWLRRNRGRPEPVVVSDNRESCRFHQRNRVFQSMNKTEYQAYLESDHWKQFRQVEERRSFTHSFPARFNT